MPGYFVVGKVEDRGGKEIAKFHPLLLVALSVQVDEKPLPKLFLYCRFGLFDEPMVVLVDLGEGRCKWKWKRVFKAKTEGREGKGREGKEKKEKGESPVRLKELPKQPLGSLCWHQVSCGRGEVGSCEGSFLWPFQFLGRQPMQALG